MAPKKILAPSGYGGIKAWEIVEILEAICFNKSVWIRVNWKNTYEIIPLTPKQPLAAFDGKVPSSLYPEVIVPLLKGYGEKRARIGLSQIEGQDDPSSTYAVSKIGWDDGEGLFIERHDPWIDLKEGGQSVPPAQKKKGSAPQDYVVAIDEVIIRYMKPAVASLRWHPTAERVDWDDCSKKVRDALDDFARKGSLHTKSSPQKIHGVVVTRKGSKYVMSGFINWKQLERCMQQADKPHFRLQGKSQAYGKIIMKPPWTSFSDSADEDSTYERASPSAPPSAELLSQMDERACKAFFEAHVYSDPINTCGHLWMAPLPKSLLDLRAPQHGSRDDRHRDSSSEEGEEGEEELGDGIVDPEEAELNSVDGALIPSKSASDISLS